MSKLEREIHIEASPDEVYDRLTNPHCLGEWVTIQEELEEAPDGELKEGDRIVQRMKIAGQRFKVSWEVCEARSPERVEWKGSGPMGSKARAVYELQANGGGTDFSYLNEYDLPGGLAGRLAGRALMRAAGGEADRSLKRLKALIEKG
jgi:carbon monoxide dehydrogenase subunit G